MIDKRVDDALWEQRDNQLTKLLMGHNQFGHEQTLKLMDDKKLLVWIEKHSVECWKCLLVGYVMTMYVYVRLVRFRTRWMVCQLDQSLNGDWLRVRGSREDYQGRLGKGFLTLHGTRLQESLSVASVSCEVLSIMNHGKKMYK